jgi:hypothetical protein
MDFNDKDRYDPELRAKAAAIHKARQDMLISAAARLREIYEDMRDLGQYGDDSIYTRCFDEIGMTLFKVDSDAAFLQKIGGETYIGNLAAGRLGQIIKNKEARK